MMKGSNEKKSKNRGYEIGNTTEDNSGHSMATYHHKWEGFTKKLRQIMKENPSLPVVVPFQLGINDGNLDCSVAYVHDHKTGEFREKIIAIHEAKGGISKNIGDNYFDLPF